MRKIISTKSVTIFLMTTFVMPQLLAAKDMRISHQLPPKHHIAKMISAWGADIEKFSGGSINVKMFGANQAFGAKQNFPAVAKGDMEAAFSVNFQWGKTIPEMNVTLKPYSVTDLDILKKWPNYISVQTFRVFTS